MSDTDTESTGVQFIRESDGRVTARHTESGVASFGESESDALRELADALESHYGDGDSIDDPNTYLSDIGIVFDTARVEDVTDTNNGDTESDVS